MSAMTINVETGNYVYYDYRRKIETVLYEANDILCHSVDGYRVILKSQIPDWESIEDPEFVYSGNDLFIVNPKTGPSIVVHYDQVVSGVQDRVAFALSHTGNMFLILQAESGLKYARIINGTARYHQLSVFPPLANPMFLKDNAIRMAIIGENLFMWDIRERDACYELTFREYAKTTIIGRLAVSFDYRITYLVDMKTGATCEIFSGPFDGCTTSQDHIKLAQNSDDFALSPNIAKFYHKDGRVVVLGHPNLDLADDVHLPLRRLTNTKSSRN